MVKKSKLQRDFEKIINENGKAIGYPMTPAKWVGGPEYRPITRILISYGGGLGGSSRYEYVERIQLSDIKPNGMIEVKTIDGVKKLLNTSFFVEVDSEITLVSVKLDSRNNNFPIGVYTYQWLARDGIKVSLINQFGG